MKNRKRGVSAALTLSMAACFALSAFGGMAGYYINSSGQHVYISDSEINNGYYYLNGQAYYAYKGSLNENYGYPNYYFRVSRYDYVVPSVKMDTLGGVRAPQATMLEASANNRNIGLKMAGMRNNLMDIESFVFGMTATQLTFEQSLGRASDKSLALIMKSAASSISDEEQYALGIYGTYDNFKKASDEGIETLILVDRDENYRISINLESFLPALNAMYEKHGARLKNDKAMVQVRPIPEEIDLGTKTGNGGAYKITIFLYKDGENRKDLTEDDFPSFHAMLKTESASRSILVTADTKTIKSADEPKWNLKASGDAYVSGYVNAGDIFLPIER